MLDVSEQKKEDVLVVSLNGKLDAVTSPTLLERLTASVDGGAHRLVLDCSRLEYISSAGLRVVLMVSQRLNQLGGRLGLASLSSQIRRIFDMAGFTTILAAYESSEKAVEAMRK